ncbi:MAG: hydroxymethylbilane synthase [FCB group bacterium]|nr:hydroxymethylbilane synthase [FCB group bacterium]
MKTLTIGSRGSQLALWQANYIRDLLQKKNDNLTVEIKPIKTRGDKIRNVPLPKIGGKGLFTKEIEDALLADEIQCAVHSLKDLPTNLPEGLVFAGSPERADPRDAFVSFKWRRLADVPDDGVIATGSYRRQALIRLQKPNVKFVELRGNIDTRLRKLREAGWDGIILAAAALERLGEQKHIAEYLNPESFIPSVSQGAIGIEVNSERTDVLELVQSISDYVTVQAVLAERAFMRRLEGGCSIPLGAWGRIRDDRLILTGFISDLKGSESLCRTLTGSPERAEELGTELADQFIALGGKEILNR